MSYRRLYEEAGPDWIIARPTLTGGPDRVRYEDQPDPNWRPRPVGFTAPLIPREPLLWEGDQA